MTSYLNEYFLTYVMLNVSTESDSVVTKPSKRRKRNAYANEEVETHVEKVTDRAPLGWDRRLKIVIDGRLYLKQNITVDKVRSVFQNYTPSISLVTSDDQESSRLSTFLDEFSNFQSNPTPDNSVKEKNYVICLNSTCNNIIVTSSSNDEENSSPSTPRNASVRLVFKADFSLYVTFDTTDYWSGYSYNTSATADTIFDLFFIYFPSTLLNVIVSTISADVSPITRRRRETSMKQMSSVTVNATVNFALDYTSNEIGNVFQDIQLLIYVEYNGHETTVIKGNVTISRSTFSDTYLAQASDADSAVSNCIYVKDL
ncbi:hypothetical protein I4U23_001526 [Adineta vaga]|nr:hypothetical protein I4U23_001526 [Adineta vaga]